MLCLFLVLLSLLLSMLSLCYQLLLYIHILKVEKIQDYIIFLNQITFLSLF
jgi:hypothetical protein